MDITNPKIGIHKKGKKKEWTLIDKNEQIYFFRNTKKRIKIWPTKQLKTNIYEGRNSTISWDYIILDLTIFLVMAPHQSAPFAGNKEWYWCAILKFLQEGGTATQRDFVALLETGDIVVVVRIPDDEPTLRIVRAEQLDAGFGVGWRPLLQLAHVLVVHAKDVVEGAKILFGDLAHLVRRVDAVLGQHLRSPLVHRSTHVPWSDGRAVTSPQVLDALLPSHVPENGRSDGRPTNIAQADEQYRSLGLLSHL